MRSSTASSTKLRLAPAVRNRQDAAVRRASSVRWLFRLPEPLIDLLLGGRQTETDGVALDRHMELLMWLTERSGHAFRSAATVERMRNGYVVMNRAYGLAPIHGVKIETFCIPLRDRELSARAYDPPGQVDGVAAPLLVFYHGGGFVIGDAACYDHVGAYFAARARVRVISIEYRLGPEHPFPAAHEDAYDAYRWIVDNVADLGADPNRLAVGGDSAGGNLAAGVCVRSRDHGVQTPAYAVLIYPSVDPAGSHRSRTMFDKGVPLTCDTIAWFTRHFSSDPADTSDVRLAPLHADLTGFPPVYFLAAGFDPLRDEGLAFAEVLRAVGTNVTYDLRPSLAHGFLNVAGVVPEAQRALEAAAGALAVSMHGPVHDEQPEFAAGA